MLTAGWRSVELNHLATRYRPPSAARAMKSSFTAWFLKIRERKGEEEEREEEKGREGEEERVEEDERGGERAREMRGGGEGEW